MRKIVLALVVLVILSGCTHVSEKEVTGEEKGRFITVYRQSHGLSHVFILRDTETGIEYLFVKSGYGGGLTVLEK